MHPLYPFCYTTIKNKKSTYVKKYINQWGLYVYECKTSWEEWSCCLGIGGFQCKVKIKTSTTPLCPS